VGFAYFSSFVRKLIKAQHVYQHNMFARTRLEGSYSICSIGSARAAAAGNSETPNFEQRL
jgi:hypothetical protein